jgi:formamidopyrimidine-DNA glycosylase
LDAHHAIMPELPEVETIVRQLAPLVSGGTLTHVHIADPRWSRPVDPGVLGRELEGSRVEAIGRRGKYIVWHLDGDRHLVQHLRMSAVVLSDPIAEPGHAHVRMVLAAANGGGVHRLVVCDPRRFGTAQLIAGTEALECFFAERLGPEPFGDAFTVAHLRQALRNSQRTIKAALLDQRVVCGVGNIYADEALFAARVHPARRAQTVTGAKLHDLRDAVVAALAAGIDARGASIDDFRHVDGVRGSFQDRFQVHLRAGQPCRRCQAEIVKTVVAGRGTYYCPRCQPAPRARRRSGAGAGAKPRR